MFMEGIKRFGTYCQRKLINTHTPGNGEDEVEGDGALVFRRVELVVVSHLSEELQCDQRGNLQRDTRQKCNINTT